jgi:MOSC domain-containing protein YiiM
LIVRIVSVQAGRVVQLGPVRTAFGKETVQGPVHIGWEGLDGDAQADRRYHGGPDMAVLAYPADHYPAWRVELAFPALPLGGFGENLSVQGALEAPVCIGDVWQAGTSRLQVASPRKPCSKIGAFWRRPDLLGAVTDSGRIGWYLRVLQEGALQAGETVALLERPHPGWNVARAFRVALARRRERKEALELSQVAALANRWKSWLRGERVFI